MCTEDVFPNKRLMQMVHLLQKRISNSVSSVPALTDQIFIEHAAELVRQSLLICIGCQAR